MTASAFYSAESIRCTYVLTDNGRFPPTVISGGVALCEVSGKDSVG
jgi:hypothetical protein